MFFFVDEVVMMMGTEKMILVQWDYYQSIYMCIKALLRILKKIKIKKI